MRPHTLTKIKKETFTSIMDALKLMVRHAISTFTELVLEAHERGEDEFVQMLIISAADELEVSHADVEALKDPMLLLDILQAKHHHNPFAWGESCLLLWAMTMGNLDVSIYLIVIIFFGRMREKAVNVVLEWVNDIQIQANN